MLKADEFLAAWERGYDDAGRWSDALAKAALVDVRETRKRAKEAVAEERARERQAAGVERARERKAVREAEQARKKAAEAAERERKRAEAAARRTPLADLMPQPVRRPTAAARVTCVDAAQQGRVVENVARRPPAAAAAEVHLQQAAQAHAPPAGVGALAAPSRRVELQAARFVRGGEGKAGDFEFEIKKALARPQPRGARTLWIYNDNEEDRFKWHKGGGNAVARPFNSFGPHKAEPLSAGVTTGSQGQGYPWLTSAVRAVIDEDLARI